jgi:hypothetical protein
MREPNLEEYRRAAAELEAAVTDLIQNSSSFESAYTRVRIADERCAKARAALVESNEDETREPSSHSGR